MKLVEYINSAVKWRNSVDISPDLCEGRAPLLGWYNKVFDVVWH